MFITLRKFIFLKDMPMPEGTLVNFRNVNRAHNLFSDISFSPNIRKTKFRRRKMTKL